MHAAARSNLSDTCSKRLNQHFTTRTAQQEQTLEIFRSLHPVEISIVIYSITIKQNQPIKEKHT